MTLTGRLHQAAQTLRNPWTLLSAGVGAGVAWAVSVPVVGVGAVGLGMLAAASAVAALQAKESAQAPAEAALRGGTPQFAQVRTLDGYIGGLRELGAGTWPPALTGAAADALSAALSTRSTAFRAAAAIDALDVALARVGVVATTMNRTNRLSAPATRMVQRRSGLQAKLGGAVDGVGEVYTRLIELSTAGDTGLDAGIDPVAEVNESLETIRTVLAELDTDARTAPEPLLGTN